MTGVLVAAPGSAQPWRFDFALPELGACSLYAWQEHGLIRLKLQHHGVVQVELHDQPLGGRFYITKERAAVRWWETFQHVRHQQAS